MNSSHNSSTRVASRVLSATTIAILLDLLLGMHLYGTDAGKLVNEKREYLLASGPIFIFFLNAIFYLMENNSELRSELRAAQSKKDVASVLDTLPDQYTATMREYQTNIIHNEQVNDNIVSLAKYIHSYLMNYPDRVRDVVPFLIFLAGTQKIKGLDEIVSSLTVYLKGINVGLERIERFKSEIVKRNDAFHDYVERSRFDLR